MLTNYVIGNIFINRGTLGLSEPQFSNILLIGQTDPSDTTISEYKSLSEVLQKYEKEDYPEYKAASLIFGQKRTVDKIFIAQKTTNETWDKVYARCKKEIDFYSVIPLGSLSNPDIESIVKLTEADKKVLAIGLIISNIEFVKTLRDNKYQRCLAMLRNSEDDYFEAGVLGRILPPDPGTLNLIYKEVVGLTPIEISRANIDKAIEYNCNFYGSFSNTLNKLYPGVLTSGDGFEVVYALDWLKATIETNIINLLVSQEKPIPFNNAGVAQVGSAINAALLLGVSRGVIEPLAEDAIELPDANLVSEQDKIQGRLPIIKYRFKLSGSIKKIGTIEGTVSF